MQMKVVTVSKEMPYAIGVSEARDSIPYKQFSIFESFVGRLSVFILELYRALNFRNTNSLSPGDGRCDLYVFAFQKANQVLADLLFGFPSFGVKVTYAGGFKFSCKDISPQQRFSQPFPVL